VSPRAVLVAALLTGCAASAAADPSTGAAAFAKLPVGARAPALGGGIAAADFEATATVANPAGLASITEAATGTCQAGVFASGENEFYLAVGGWATPETAVGVSVFSRGLGDIEFRIGNSEDPMATKSASAQVYAVAAAFRFFPALDAGISVKYLSETVGTADVGGLAADAFSSDAAIQYRPWPRVAAAFVARDIPGTSLGWNPQSSTGGNDDLVRSLVLGAAVDLNPVLLVGQIDELTGDYRRFSGGVEWDLHPSLTVRAGLNNGAFAAGFGGRVTVRRRYVLRLDYALARNPYGGSSLDHRFALTIGYHDYRWKKGRLLFPTVEEESRPNNPEWLEPSNRPPLLFTWPDLSL